ncbi:MAG: lytic murein transglycosylase [Rhodospirillaceae bacterium]|nr:lytic murein transglycosylase [Rhodospirillaceae bacterium]
MRPAIARRGVLRGAAALAAAGAGLLPGLRTAEAQPTEPFAVFLQRMSSRAMAEGISSTTVQSAFAGLTPSERVMELEGAQPEFTRTFWQYMDNAVTDGRVAEGRARYAQNRALLDRVEAEYGVPGAYLVAFWGLETNFGSYLGDFDVIQALATLTYNDRRADLFGAELIAALHLIDNGWVRRDQLIGSWAGAIGNCQFLPTTYRRFAVDFDGDGRRDLYGSLPDVFASAANYLSSIGWESGYIWGREALLPAAFPWEQADLTVRKTLAEWQALGVRQIDGSTLPVAPIEASVVVPMGHRGPAFLVYDNFRVIMQWNRSVPYAVAVGHLADRIEGGGPLRGARPNLGDPLSRDEIEEMQRLLNARGYNAGTPDGRIGPNTRSALRGWQRSVGMPADGYPTRDQITRLRTG